MVFMNLPSSLYRTKIFKFIHVSNKWVISGLNMSNFKPTLIHLINGLGGLTPL